MSYFAEMESPVGALTLICTDAGLTHVCMDNSPLAIQAGATRGHRLLDDARRQLEEYFAGNRLRLDLPLAAHGTPFQREVWAALADIPFGEARSYGEIARFIGRSGASRAIGAANGANPLSIVVPCHRVIGANGTLTGYGGGLERKQWLLEHEREVAAVSV